MQVNMYGAADAARKRLAEQTAQQGDQGDANQGNTAASHELLHPLTLYSGVQTHGRNPPFRLPVVEKTKKIFIIAGTAFQKSTGSGLQHKITCCSPFVQFSQLQQL